MSIIELLKYNQDTSAEAVILFDIGSSHFVETDNNFEIVFEQTKRIKILKDEIDEDIYNNVVTSV